MSLFFPTPSGTHATARSHAVSFTGVALAHALLLGLLLALTPAGRLGELVRPLTVRLIEQAPERPPAPKPEPPRPKPRPLQPERIVAATAPGPVVATSFTVAPQPEPPPVSTPSAVSPAPTFVPSPPVQVTAARFDAAYLNNPKPAYPNVSRRLGEEGKVVLRVQVDATGHATDIDIKTSSGFPRLDTAAREAVAQWRFVPARRGDEAIAAWVLVPIVFSLES